MPTRWSSPPAAPRSPSRPVAGQPARPLLGRLCGISAVATSLINKTPNDARDGSAEGLYEVLHQVGAVLDAYRQAEYVARYL
jgi:hypothetical protein